MKIFVTLTNDVSGGVLSHLAMLPPLPLPVPVPMPSIESPVPAVGTMAGQALNQHKFTTTVLHKNKRIAHDGHDAGAMIPQITPTCPLNVLYAVSWPMASRKIPFGASTVKMNGTPAGGAQPGPVPLPLMTCGEPISGPLALNTNNILNTLRVGLTGKDILDGLASIAVSVAIDLVMKKIFPGKPFALSPSKVKIAEPIIKANARKYAAQEIAKGWAGQFFDKEEAIKALTKSGLSAAGELLTSSLKGDPTFKLAYGTPFVGAEAEIGGKGGKATGTFLGWKQSTDPKDTASWGTPLSEAE